jgi:hypothetical protein
MTKPDEASPSASQKFLHMQKFTTSRRSISRGVYFRGWVYGFAVDWCRRHGVSFSGLVNKALELFLAELSDKSKTESVDRFLLECKRQQLLYEEKELRETLRVILRSGAYLKDYAKELLLGDSEQISYLKKRVGVYSHIKPRELNIILRILKRREDLVNELLEIEDKLLPSSTYPFMVTEHGWKIGDSLYARDKLRRLSKAKTGSSPRTKDWR